MAMEMEELYKRMNGRVFGWAGRRFRREWRLGNAVGGQLLFGRRRSGAFDDVNGYRNVVR